jgi:hypothetical protein
MSRTTAVAAALRALVPPRADGAASAWFEAAWAEVAAGASRERFLTLFAGAGRRLGRAVMAPDDAESARLRAAGMAPGPAGWGLDECGRGALLLLATEPLGGQERVALASELYAHGEVRERQAVLRVLPYAPEPRDLRDLALEACRTSAQSVFEAVACDNPFPAAHFAEGAFNQMVLKALFTGARLSRVVDLERRVTPELVRMAGDYAAERRAAGRAVPEDVDLILSVGTRNA